MKAAEHRLTTLQAMQSGGQRVMNTDRPPGPAAGGRLAAGLPHCSRPERGRQDGPGETARRSEPGPAGPCRGRRMGRPDPGGRGGSDEGAGGAGDRESGAIDGG